jgi:hypothetical protein
LRALSHLSLIRDVLLGKLFDLFNPHPIYLIFKLSIINTCPT